MKVRAKFPHNGFGFYGGLRRYDGDEFSLESKSDFSGLWMEVVEEQKASRRQARQKSSAIETGEGAE